MTIGFIDLFVLLLFFAITLIIGVWHRGSITLDDYWVNRRNTNRFVLVATSLSTFIGAGSILSTASFAFSGGGAATLVIPASFCIYAFVFARLFAPKIKAFGDAHGAYTVPDYLSVTYSRRVALSGSIVILISWALYLAVQMLAIGSFVSTLVGIDPVIATVLAGALVVSYTSVGGLQADIRTDVFQFIIMMFLLIVFLPWLAIESGGALSPLSLPREFLTGNEVLSPAVAIAALVLYGAGILTSADMWQRVYAADTAKNARWAMSITSVLILAFIAMGTLFGIYGKVLLPNADPNLIVPQLLSTILPHGLYGLILAGFFAAILSSADSVLLVTSMTLVHDIGAKQLGIKLSLEQTLRASRWVTFIVGVIGVVVAVAVFSLVHLSIHASSFYVALLPSIVFGFYAKRRSELGAFASIVVGALTILIAFQFDPIRAFIPGIFLSFVAYGVGSTVEKAGAKAAIVNQ